MTNEPHQFPISDHPDLPNRKLTRLKGFDYSMPGNYFVTLVTQGRINCFGTVTNGTVILNDVGQMIETCYKELNNVKENVECLDYVIMPNHLHFILRLYNTDSQSQISLSELVRRLKSKTTVKYIHGVKRMGWPPFDRHLWQKGFYDHIIRNERAYDYIRNYIFMNPLRWFYDKINPNCSSTPDEIYQGIKALYT